MDTTRFRTMAGIACLAGIAVVSCQAAPEAEPPTVEPAAPVFELRGTSWFLLTLGDPADPTPVVEGAEITAVFDAEKPQVSGSSGCNDYFANYEVSGGDISIGEAVTTLMLCEPDELNAQESAYMRALSTVRRYDVKEGTLAIEYDGGMLIFRRREA